MHVSQLKGRLLLLSQTTQQDNNSFLHLIEPKMHNNIMNRNIDLLLKPRSTQQARPTKRINKYELAYGKTTPETNRQQTACNQFSQQSNQHNALRSTNGQFNIPVIRKDEIGRLSNQSSFSENERPANRNETSQLDKRVQYIDAKNRLSTENSIDEISEANNSQTNSISSNTSYLRFDVKSQPIMAFQSIAYVQANRLNSNLMQSNLTNHTSSLNKLMNLGSSNTSSDLPACKMGESLDDSSLDTARIQDICNLSTSTTDDELRESMKSSDTDDCPTLIDELNNSSFNTSFNTSFD